MLVFVNLFLLLFIYLFLFKVLVFMSDSIKTHWVSEAGLPQRQTGSFSGKDSDDHLSEEETVSD